MDREIRNTTRNIGSKWRKIGDGGKGICSPDIVKIHS